LHGEDELYIAIRILQEKKGKKKGGKKREEKKKDSIHGQYTNG
jgi:hypothetical protein